MNSLKLVLMLSLFSAATVHAEIDQAALEMNDDYLTIKSVQVNKLHTDLLNQELSTIVDKRLMNTESIDPFMYGYGLPNRFGTVDQGGQLGQVISTGRDLVALGESVYALVSHGKPVNKVTYAPISVMPRVGNDYVDVLDTENWKMPRKETYRVVYTNMLGMDVIKYTYSVIYAYGGSYNGKGAYITAAQMIPESIETNFGFSFSATMKLSGMQNLGTKANPVAAAMLTMQYTVETVLQSVLESKTFFITGRGGFKQI